MTHKIHFRATVQGHSACAVGVVLTSGKVVMNQRKTYAAIPDAYVVHPEEFRAAAPADRCQHCCDRFQVIMNGRRVKNGKQPYKNVWTKEI